MRCVSLALLFLLLAPDLRAQSQSLGQGELPPGGEEAQDRAGEVMTRENLGVNRVSFLPRVTYSIAPGTRGELVRSPHLDPVVDTPAFENHPTRQDPAGTCFGMCRLVEVWYKGWVHPARSGGRPDPAFREILLHNSRGRTGGFLPWNRLWTSYHVRENLRLRPFSSGPQRVRGTDYEAQPNPYANPEVAARIATNLHDDQWAGVENLQPDGARNRAFRRNTRAWGTLEHQYRLAELLKADIGDPERAMSVVALLTHPGTPTIGGLHPAGHAILVHGYQSGRARSSEGRTHPVWVFRIYDPNRVPDEAYDRGPEALLYFRDMQRFAWSEAFLRRYKDIRLGGQRILWQVAPLIHTYGLVYYRLHDREIRLERYTQNLRQGDVTADQPGEDFDWGR